MSLSMGPFITCFLASAFLTLYLYIVLYHKKNIFKCNVKIIFWGISLILIRMAFPVNFPFVYTVYSNKILIPPANILYKYIGIKDYMIFDILLMVWFAVSIIKLILFIIHSINLKKLLMLYIDTNFPQYCLVESILKKYNVSHIKIALVPNKYSPAIFGLFHPILILPCDMDLNESELEYILLHEIKHYKHHDLWLKLLLEIVVCIHWWNPLVYLMKKEFNLAMEISNDTLIINNSSKYNYLSYANCILKVAKLPHLTKTYPSSLSLEFVSYNRSNLETRINFLLDAKNYKNRTIDSFSFHVLLMTIVVFTSFLFVFDPCYDTPIPEFHETSEALTKDNTYIIKKNNTFDLYVNNEFLGTLKNLPNALKDFNIYQEGEPIFKK